MSLCAVGFGVQMNLGNGMVPSGVATPHSLHPAVAAHASARANGAVAGVAGAAGAAGGTNWFNDARVPVGSVPKSMVKSGRNRYGTSRTYSPVMDGGEESRALYEAHVDVSDQFTTFGKTFIGLNYFAFWIILMFPDWFLPIGRPGIALGGGMTMVIFRYIFVVTGQGPEFDAEGVIILEPLFLLFGLMLTTIYLEKMEVRG